MQQVWPYDWIKMSSNFCFEVCPVYIYYIIYIMFLYLYTVHLLQILEKKPERRFCFSRNLSDTSRGRFFSSCSYHIKPKTRISQLFKCGLSGLFHVFYFWLIVEMLWVNCKVFHTVSGTLVIAWHCCVSFCLEVSFVHDSVKCFIELLSRMFSFVHDGSAENVLRFCRLDARHGGGDFARRS